jgi:hypothetical protein
MFKLFFQIDVRRFPFKDSFKKKYNRLTSETCKQIHIGNTERVLSYIIKEDSKNRISS